MKICAPERCPTNGHYRALSDRQDFSTLVQSQDDPVAIVAEIRAFGEHSGFRSYSDVQTDWHYSACQYYLTIGMIAMGRVEEGLQRSVVGEPAEKSCTLASTLCAKAFCRQRSALTSAAMENGSAKS